MAVASHFRVTAKLTGIFLGKEYYKFNNTAGQILFAKTKVQFPSFFMNCIEKLFTNFRTKKKSQKLFKSKHQR